MDEMQKVPANDAESMDAQGRVLTFELASVLGKQAQQLSSYRQRLIKKRLIEPDDKGYARLLLPYIPEYYSALRT